MISQLYPESLAVLADPRNTATTDIDVVFDRAQARWLGSFTRAGIRRSVELRRPGMFAAGPLVKPFLGRWCSSSAGASSCFTIAQEVDGIPTGSTDRSSPCGLSLRIPRALACGFTIDIAADAKMVFIGERFAACCPNWFGGRLSDDDRIEGNWRFGKNPSLPSRAVYVRAK